MQESHLEESRAAVTGEDAVVFARGVVLTHLTRDVVQDAACRGRRGKEGG